jgi:hypothetical protein
MEVNKKLFSMMSLGVFSVAVAGFGLPAEGGLFGLFGHHHSYYSDCGCPPACSGYCAPMCGGYCAPMRSSYCAPACSGYCTPMCGTYCDNDYDDDDHAWCGHGYRACGHTACSPMPVPSCACPPPVNYCGYVASDCDDDDDDCDD